MKEVEEDLSENFLGPSKKYFKPYRDNDDLITERLSVVFDRFKVSDRDIVNLLFAIAESLGNDTNKLFINRSSIQHSQLHLR